MSRNTISDKKPLITFALFTYNQEKYIREAIQGALSQPYNPLEIIISDDHSTDKTFEIIEECTKDYVGPHRLIINRNSKNKGLSGHVNAVCIDLATGEWIATAVGDDISLPERIQKAWEIIIKSPTVKGIHCGVRRIDATGVFLNDVLPQTININIIDRESMLGAAAVYHRDVFDIFGPMGVHVQNEDMVLSLRALLIGDIISSKHISVLWRRHSNNLSGQVNSSFLRQAKWLYTIYYNKRLFSSIQQLNDLLFIFDTNHDEKIAYQNLQIRLSKKIKCDGEISIFSKWLFDKETVPFSIKCNLFLWWFFLSYFIKHFIVNLTNKVFLKKGNT